MITLTIKDDETGEVETFDINAIVAGLSCSNENDGCKALIHSEGTGADFVEAVAEAKIAIEGAFKTGKKGLPAFGRMVKKVKRQFEQENKKNGK